MLLQYPTKYWIAFQENLAKLIINMKHDILASAELIIYLNVSTNKFTFLGFNGSGFSSFFLLLLENRKLSFSM